MYHGDIRLSDTIDIKFTTRQFSNGAPTTLSGTPTVAAYPGNSVTEITAGITLTVDFDARTGLNNVRVVATGANGYATATNYTLVITAGTVGGTSVVGECVGSFSIENRSALIPTTAGRTLDVSATGEAGVDWANVGGQGTSVTLSATTVNDVTTKSGYSLSAAGVDAVWDEDIVAAHGTADTAGRALRTLDTISDRTNNSNLNSLLGVADSAGATVASQTTDEVWDEARSGHVAAGSFGEGVASVQGNVTGTVNDVVSGVAVETGGIASTSFAAGAIDAAAIAADAIGASELAATAAQEVADEVLSRNLVGGASNGARNVRNALRALRNRVTESGGTLTVYEEDDSTTAWTATVTRTASTDPITSVDPA